MLNIQQTTDYSKFKPLEGNRPLNQAHIKQLMTSITAKNQLKYRPIEVNDRLEVLDGQHRLEAARRLGFPIHYRLVRKSNIEDTILFNANQWTWKVGDYLNSYVKRGNQDYLVLQQFIEQHSLPVSVGVRLLMKKGDSDKSLYLFKSGAFVANNQKHANHIGELLALLKPHCEAGVARSREFIKTLATIDKKAGFDWKRLAKKLSRREIKITKQKNIREYLREIENIYKYKSKNMGDFRLF